jgi:hypothetical protein
VREGPHVSETHTPQGDILKRMRHDGCGGRPGWAADRADRRLTCRLSENSHLNGLWELRLSRVYGRVAGQRYLRSMLSEFSETHSAQGDMLIRDIIARMRHDGCGGRAGKVELLTGIGASSWRRCGGSY